VDRVPTLNIRNVPSHVVSDLKRRAKRNGRSLNAEVVEALGASADEDRRRRAVRERLEALRARGPLLSKDAPTAEVMIRWERTRRAREVDRRARRS
jgi:plasmid stability protein